MGGTKRLLWDLLPHTKAKHIILKKYLEAWMPILSKHEKVIYIDGFAGPGEYTKSEEGSPIIAINTVLNHILLPQMKADFQFIFIEKNPTLCSHLEGLCKKLPNKPNIKIDCKCGEFHTIVDGILTPIEKEGKTLAPTFVFIDPFGFAGVPLSLINRLMKNDKCEVLINFMYEDISRWFKNPGNKPHLNEMFGNNKWKEVLSSDKSAQEKTIELHNVYRDQLLSQGNIKYVRSFMMKNKFNKPDYFLFFGTNSLVGLKAMKEAMWKVDRHGSFQFSDATYDPNQAVLFEPEPNYGRLKKEILTRYKGKKVSIKDLENFVLVDTAFLTTHIRKPILDKMEHTTPVEIKVECNKKRRKGTFPEGTSITFL